MNWIQVWLLIGAILAIASLAVKKPTPLEFVVYILLGPVILVAGAVVGIKQRWNSVTRTTESDAGDGGHPGP